MSADPRAVASAYFEAWVAKDFETLRSLLADDVTFRGPLGRADDADACLKGLRGMGEIVTDIAIRKMWGDGSDVITWFELHTSVAAPFPTVNWSRVVDGRIEAIRVTFDPRPLLSPDAER